MTRHMGDTSLGSADERNLFPDALRVIDEIRLRAVILKNVHGFLGPVFQNDRRKLKHRLFRIGYEIDWRLLKASDFSVPQLRPRVVIVAIRKDRADLFSRPADGIAPPTVGEALSDLMAERGWRGAERWKEQANGIAPTIVGGSKKHGEPDLGPVCARQALAALGVDGRGVSDLPPERGCGGCPRLTVRMGARLQGIPGNWKFSGRKTSAWRQVGNAFPPPVAQAVAAKLRQALTARNSIQVTT